MAATKLTVASILAAFTISCAAEGMNPTPAISPLAPWPTYWPTYVPTYLPTASAEESLPFASVRCPSSFESFVQIDDAASMQYSIVQSDDPLQSGIFCARLFVDSANDGWVALGFSETGNMPGSDAIVADLKKGSVLKYHLGGRDPSAVVLMEDQTLQDTYVGVHESMAVVEFTKLLVEKDEVAINEDGVNIFLHARGDVWPGYHTSKTVFVDVVKNKWRIANVCDETRPCPDGEYCKLEPGKCVDASESQVGTCVRIHDNCNWPVSYEPICGCDGETYGNECEVDESGTSVAYEGHCELADERQADLSTTSPCPENQCLSPDGECAGTVNCFVDPCDVQDECAYAECEANYCGGCHHVCNDSMTKVSDDIACAEIWQPVCGDDNITYSNRCEANKADNVNIMYEGECKDIAAVQSEEKCYPGGRCSTEGSSCSEGTETCCGQTYDSLKCECSGGSWMCFHTDACMFPSCCATGPPEDKPAPSMEFCVTGSACDTEFDDDYCCNDFTNPGNTYCTKSGGMPAEPTDTQPATTEATTTTTIAVTTEATTTTTNTTTSASPSPAPTKVTETASTTTAPTVALTSFPSAPPIEAQTTSTEGTTSTLSQATTAPTMYPTSAPTSSPTAPPIEVQTTSTEGTTTSSTYQTTSSALNISSIISAITNETSSTNHQEVTSPKTDGTTTTDSNALAPQTTITSSTISVMLDNSDTSALMGSGTESIGATTSTTVPSTTTTFSFEVGFSTTTTPELGSDLETTTEPTSTETEPTSFAIGTVEGRQSTFTSAAEKNAFRLFSLSSISLALAAWYLI